MNRLRTALRYALAGTVGAVLSLGAGLVLFNWHRLELGQGLVNASYNSLFAFRAQITPDKAVLVYLDDHSHVNLKQSYTAPWDRNYHALLVQKLLADGAQAVVFDIVFSDPGISPEQQAADRRFARSIHEHGKVILAADWAKTTEGLQVNERLVTKQAVPPFDLLAEQAADVGLDELDPDADFIVRKHFAGSFDFDLSSLSWAAAKLVGAPVAKTDQFKQHERWMSYYGPPGTLPHISFYQAIANDLEGPPKGFFRNKVVFVGARIQTYMSGQRKDEYKNPYSYLSKENFFMPGVEIHATEFLNLWRGDWLERLSTAKQNLLIMLVGLFFGVGLPMLRPGYASIVAVSGIAVVTWAAHYVFLHDRLWFAWLIPVAVQIPLAGGWSVVFNSINLYVQKRLMEQSLAMYVSPRRVRQIAQRQEILRPGAEKQELSILFSDIAGFTSLSEGMDSDQLARVMNHYFENAVTNCIHKTDGTVVKFIGDAIFAIWNAPEKQPNHQELAARGALLLRDQVTRSRDETAGLELQTRIGLHCGVANVGNFGSSTRLDYTAIGENINLASRMEGLNKHLGTTLLATGDIYQTVSDKFIARFAGDFRLKGFEKTVAVYELVGLGDEAEESRAWREAFQGALEHFQRRRFSQAEPAFKQVLQLHPDDGPAKFYLQQIQAFRETPPPEDWSGEIELKEK